MLLVNNVNSAVKLTISTLSRFEIVYTNVSNSKYQKTGNEYGRVRADSIGVEILFKAQGLGLVLAASFTQ